MKKIRAFFNRIGRLFVNFIKGLLSSKSDVGSKRFIAILTALNLNMAVTIRTLNGPETPEWMLILLAMFSLTLFGFNTYLLNKTLNLKSDIATTLINKEPESDTAKDVKDIVEANKV